MKSIGLRRIFGLCCLLSIAAVALGQGLYWESTTSGGPLGDAVRGSKSYAMPKMFKHEAEGNTTIVRLDKQLMYTVDPKQKTYSEITFAELESFMQKAGSKTDAKMEELQKKMKGMPEEQRKMMEKMLGGQMGAMMQGGEVSVTNTGEKKTISGFACMKYVAKQGDKEFLTAWATNDVKDFAGWRKDWEEVNKRLMAGNKTFGKGMVDAMQKIEGFPVEMTIVGVKTTVVKVEKKTVAASEFEVPAGYKKVKSKMMEDLEKQ